MEICSQCHPFFTGKQKLMDTAGRVERFQKKVRAERNTNQEPRAMIQVGGQAVIEGVMMKAPKSLAVVVRKPNGEIAFKRISPPFPIAGVSSSGRCYGASWPSSRP